MPATMHLVNLYDRDDFRVDEVPVPEIAAGDVLVQVKACGICGSDLGYVADGGMGGASATPMPLGHELSGVISAIGDQVHGMQEGMRVVVNPMSGDNNIGNGGAEGGFANYLRVRNVATKAADALVPLPDSIPFEIGALVEPLAVATHAVNQAQAGEGTQAAVFGVGPIGLGTVAVMKARGVRHIVAIDISDTRLKLAAEMGADLCLHAERDAVFEALGEVHGTADLYGAPTVQTGVFILATGSETVLQDVLRSAGVNARVVIVGLYKKPVAVDFLGLLMRELHIVGAMGYPRAEFLEVIRMLDQGELDVRAMISSRFALEDFAAAFATARDAEHGGKVLVDMELGG